MSASCCSDLQAAANRRRCFLSPDWWRPIAAKFGIDGNVVSSGGKIHVPPQSRGVGMVFQDLALWPHMSVAENIGFGLRARRVPAAECRTAHSTTSQTSSGLAIICSVQAGRTFRRRATACRAGKSARAGAAHSADGRAAFESRCRAQLADCEGKSCACMPNWPSRSSMSRIAATKRRKSARARSSWVKAERCSGPSFRAPRSAGRAGAALAKAVRSGLTFPQGT